MKRHCFLLRVKPERMEEYRQRHARVWPEMLDALRRCGWRNYSLFLHDDGLLVGYVEIDGRLKRMLTVVKMRRSAHSQDIRAYEITSSGMNLGKVLKGYRGLISGMPTPLEKIRKSAR